MTDELQRDKIFVPSSVFGKLMIVLSDISSTRVPPGRRDADMMER